MFQLTDEDQRLLLQIARNAVRSYLSGRPPRLPEVPPTALTEPQATFVSIHKGEDLRGCIGNIHPAGPLYRSVAECAIGAAVGDPRFMPLSAPELPEVEFEISVLSLLQRVDDIREIQVGKHGLLVSKGTARGLLLPQVAAMYNWDQQRFLQETCRKAGLKIDDLKNVTVQSFSAVVFDEKKFHHSITT